MQTVVRRDQTRTEQSPVNTGAGTAQRTVAPVKIWAGVGVFFVSMTLYAVVKWVTGPNFARVTTGPDQPPGWMKAVLTGSQIVIPIAAVAVILWFLVRPWRRNGVVSFDGLLCIGVLAASVWDPASAYFRTWFAYNSYMVNMGSPLTELPGMLAPHGPGRAVAWPMIAIPAIYVAVIVPWIVVGCALMKAVKRKFPDMRAPTLLALMVVTMMAADIIIEGVIFMPLGFWSYGGGWWPVLNGGKYYQLPLNDMLHVGIAITAWMATRYFTNDKGETLAERGASTIKNPRHRTVLRTFAVIGIANTAIFATYHIPNALWGGVHSREFPQDVKDRSYFMNDCGPRFDRACPAPDVPLSKEGSGYVDWNGNWVSPDRAGR